MADENELLYRIEVDQKALLKQLNKVEKNFNDTFSDIDKSASNMNLMGSILGADAIKAGLSTAKDLIVDGLTKIVEETSQLETATIKWEQLLGSAESADLKIKEVFEFSNKTPFTFKGVDEATQMLYKLSNGALNSMEDITLLGDASSYGGVGINELSVTWGRLYQKFEQGDKAFAEEINRMNELGIITGETKAELQGMNSELLKEKGWKTFKEGAEAVAGTMDKTTKSIAGALSTLSGTWDGMFAFDDKDVQKGIQASVDSLTSTLNANKDDIQDILIGIFSITSSFVNDWVKGAIEIKKLFTDGLLLKEDKKLIELGNNQLKKQLDLIKKEKELLNYQNKLEDRKIQNVKDLKTNENKSSEFASILNTDGKIGNFWKGLFTFSRIENKKVKLTGNESLEDIGNLMEDIDKLVIQKTKYPDDYKGVKDPEIEDYKSYLKQIYSQKLEEYDIEQESLILTNKKVELEKIKLAKEKKIIDLYKTIGTGSIDFATRDFLYGNAFNASGTSNTGLSTPNAGLQIPSLVDRYNLGYDELVKSTNPTSTTRYISSTKKDDDDVVSTEQYLQGITQMVNSTESAMLSMDSTIKTWSKDSNTTFSEGMARTASIMANLSSGAGGVAGGLEGAGIVGSLGALIPGLNLASAGFGLASSLFSIFGSSGDDEPEDPYNSGSLSSSNRADIVSNKADVYQTINFTISAGYIGGEVATSEFYEQQVVPRIAEASSGVL